MDGLGEQFQDVEVYLGCVKMPNCNYYTITRMPTLYATKESYSRILEWGQNTSEEWYHPVSRSQFQSLSSVKQGDIIEFVLDGVPKDIQVLEVGKMCEYYLLKHVNGDFKMPDTFVENVIRVGLVTRV